MRITLLKFVFFLFTLSLWSQKTSDGDFTISINGNKILTTSNFKQKLQEKKSTGKQIPKEEYTLLQFSAIPTVEEQQNLKSQGITLLSYLNNNAYYAKISSSLYGKNVNSPKLRALIDIEPQYKLDPMIVNNVIPDYAEESNLLKVVVSYFEGVDISTISLDLTTLHLRDVRIEELFNEIYLLASREKLNEIAKLNWVQNIELTAPPVESENLPGLTSHKANILGSAIPGLGYGLTGKGVKVGVWDGNLEQHKDFTGRVINREYESNSSHGAHVAGTIGGAGLLDPKAKGMAPEVQMYGWNFNTQSNGLSVQQERVIAATQDGVEISSNSYGVNLTSGYNTGRYNTGDRNDDIVTYTYPYFLNIYSNGNAQTAYPGGFNTSTKNSKNSLHVGANNPNDLMSSYSSFGPTIDGRLVPQIAAVGTDVYSLDYSNSYQVMSGTSMATPGTTGVVALLYERYKNIFNQKPLASLMKALVANTAKDAGNPGPDYKYGFGNLNGLRAVKVLDKNMFYTGSVANGATFERDISVPAGLLELKVMLAYSDVGGTPGSSAVLVNDLDITIVKDGQVITPWILNPTTPNANAVRGIDNVNNIEQITLANPAPGTYKIVVTGSRVPLNTQQFSVVYDFVAPELTLTYPVGGEKFNPGATDYIRWDYEGEPKPFTLEYSIDGGTTFQLIAKDIPSTARNFAWKVPADVVANAKIRVIAGARVDVSKEIFNIIKEPENVVIAPSICGASSYQMDWDAIPGSKYEVLKLNGYKFDVVATVTSPTYTFPNVTVEDDNWFSVRAVDIATGIVSERVRAVNVEPVSAPVLNALNLPFIENFNSRKPTNYVFTKGLTGLVKYEYITADLLDGAKMAGSGTPSASPWVASTTANAFANNPDYIKKVSFCDIDATSLTGKVIRLKFNLLWRSVGPANKNFFRLTVNGTPVPSTQNVTVYGGTVLSGNTELLYDLSAFAGTTFSLAFESAIDNDSVIVSNEYVYSAVYIDNVTVFEVTEDDLELSALTPNSGFTGAETVKIKVYNHSAVAVSNVPVSYKVNNGAEIAEIIPGPIAPLTEVSYDFAQKADFSAEGVYTVMASVNYATDALASNNSLSKRIANIGSDIVMGSGSNFTTCAATFTDAGTRYGNYADQVTQTITFTPGASNSSIKVDFTEFDVEEDYDFLYVYNGPNTSSPLLGAFSGNSLPPSLTSTATNGQLTFRFVSDQIINEEGWVATITCVPKVILNDVAIASITEPEVLGKKSSTDDITIRVTNLGAAALTDYPVFYQVNGGSKITELVPAIGANASLNYTFTTKADLSIIDAEYTITSGVDIPDDNAANDIIEKIVYNKNDLPIHTNVDGYAISKLKWGDVENTSGTTAYSDFTSVKIPVYAGFTYQPEVTIIKPDVPITRDQTTSVGVFTMIVIDLNGDGNLTDEFYAGNFWVNTLQTSASPAIPSTTSTHYFRNNFSLTGGLTIPAGTIPGEKQMRVIHMYRSPLEYYNVVLGPTFDGLTSSREDFEVEEYTINVLPFTPANASVERIVLPVKPGKAPVTVTTAIRNLSNAAISNFPIAYKINGGAEVLETVTATIAAGGLANYTFATKADLSNAADYTLEVYTKLIGDTDPTNDGKTVTLSHVADYPTNVVGTFDGINDFIKTDTSPTLNLTNNYTFETWVNQKEATIYGRLLDKSTALVFIHNDSNLSIYKENSLVVSITTAMGSYVINTEENSIKKNVWHHIAYSVSSSNVYKIYIDGVEVPFTSTGVAAAASNNSSAAIYVGNNAGLARGLNGYIDEVRIWSGVRSQAQLIANATTKYVGNEPNLVAYYPFSEANKQFVFDRTVSDNTAVVTNADTEGLGEGKFWNVPVLMQSIDFVNQLATSYDAASKTYSVVLNDGADVTNVVANFSLGMNSTAIINGNVQISGSTANDYTNPVTLRVVGNGFNTGLEEIYTIKVSAGLSDENKLLSYDFKTINNPALSSEINTDIIGHNVVKTLPFGVDVTNLIANFELSPGATLYIDDVLQLNSQTNASDYTTSLLVTVVSENKLSKTNYVVTLNANNSEANILDYAVQNQVGASVIDPVAKTVTVFVNNNADFSSLVPVFELSDFAILQIGTYPQTSGVSTLNYSAPIVYNVVAQNGTIENWLVTVTYAKPEIILLGDAVVNMDKGCIYTEAGYTATDNLSVDITADVVVTGTVDVNTPGQYILTYTVSDALQNEATVTRIVNVSTVGCTLGLPVNNIKGLVLYPNPVIEAKVYIETDSDSTKNIWISDLSGKNILTTQTEEKEISLNDFSAGVYIIKIEQDGNTSIEKLIVK